MKSRLCSFLMMGLILSVSAVGAADHTAWEELLTRYVEQEPEGALSCADYAGLATDRDQLSSYLETLSAVTPDDYSTWSQAAQLAFLINAYNAFTVELILSEYPLDSIRDIGGLFSNPWKRKYFTLLGERRSLDDVEHGMIRGAQGFDEPRIHFAVNCASVGCPALRDEAFIGADLNAQLEDQTQRFLADPRRTQLDPERGILTVSPIFKWYREDFADGDVAAWIAQAMGQPELAAFEVEFADYDWSLNDC